MSVLSCSWIILGGVGRKIADAASVHRPCALAAVDVYDPCVFVVFDALFVGQFAVGAQLDETAQGAGMLEGGVTADASSSCARSDRPGRRERQWSASGWLWLWRRFRRASSRRDFVRERAPSRLRAPVRSTTAIRLAEARCFVSIRRELPLVGLRRRREGCFSARRDATIELSPGRRGAGFGNQLFEERARQRIAAHAFGMPLHADHPRVAGPFYRFDHAIGGARGDLQTAAGLEHRLMMRAIHEHACRVGRASARRPPSTRTGWRASARFPRGRDGARWRFRWRYPARGCRAGAR